MKKLISEQAVIEASKKGEKTLTVDDKAIITDAAKDRARQLGITFTKKAAEKASTTPAAGAVTKSFQAGDSVVIGSDHGGFALKEQLKAFLESIGAKVVDVGTYSEEACDYPDYAYAVARTVSLGHASKGIMIDSVGIASAMVANKVKGVRAACCTDEFGARSSREHNDANVLTLGGKVLGVELAKAIVKTWMETNFGGGRHMKRVAKITEIEGR
ncbi:MAG TPA: ribose 5-phosphate isomerase B [Bacteroidota bacterium]|jgi:ribose 5-phosphate isomerase B|nr:ribose 5-phosphate isomerase B [Bacteroidota bacterium]